MSKVYPIYRKIIRPIIADEGPNAVYLQRLFMRDALNVNADSTFPERPLIVNDAFTPTLHIDEQVAVDDSLPNLSVSQQDKLVMADAIANVIVLSEPQLVKLDDTFVPAALFQDSLATDDSLPKINLVIDEQVAMLDDPVVSLVFKPDAVKLLDTGQFSVVFKQDTIVASDSAPTYSGNVVAGANSNTGNSEWTNPANMQGVADSAVASLGSKLLSATTGTVDLLYPDFTFTAQSVTISNARIRSVHNSSHVAGSSALTVSYSTDNGSSYTTLYTATYAFGTDGAINRTDNISANSVALLNGLRIRCACTNTAGLGTNINIDCFELLFDFTGTLAG